jgi:uncharacterized protein involved in exopolysaccharide biosynthesis
MSEVESKSPPLASLPPEVELNLAPYLSRIFRSWRILAVFVGVAVVVGVATAYLVPPVFTAESSFILPTSSGNGNAALAAQLGNVGGSGILGLGKNQGDMLVGVLQSQTVLRSIVDRFDLRTAFHVKLESDAIKTLLKETKFADGAKDSIVTISVTDKSAIRARDLANAYLDALQRANETFALTESSQRRLFYEQRLEQEKEALANAEVELKKSQEQTGLIQPASQTTIQIDTIAKIRAEITAREVQLASMRQAETDQNPQVVGIRSEISNLQSQLNAMENGTTTADNVPTSQMPELALEVVRKQREVRYHETLFDILAKQYESARMDEMKVGPTLQILDRATLPEAKSGPSRALILFGFVSLGMVLGIVWIFFSSMRDELLLWYSRTFQTKEENG